MPKQHKVHNTIKILKQVNTWAMALREKPLSGIQPRRAT